MFINIKYVKLSEKAQKLFGTKNCQLFIEDEMMFIKGDSSVCLFVSGLQIQSTSIEFYFLDMDGETLLHFNNGEITQKDNWRKNRLQLLHKTKFDELTKFSNFCLLNQ